MNVVFKNEENVKEFAEQGFIQIPNIPFSIIEECERLLNAHFGELPDGMYISHYESELTKNIEVSTSLQQVFLPWLEKVFKDYKYVLGHFIAKSHKNSSEFRLHQDWSVVDENIQPFVHIWVPLDDTSKENGGLYVLPKSHLFFENKRSGSLNIPFVDIQKDLSLYIKNLNVAKGEAILYHPALFHGSLPNLSQLPRRTVLLTLTHKEATLKYFHKREDNQIDSYVVDTQELLGNLKNLAQGLPPEKYASIEPSIGVNSLDNYSIGNSILLRKIQEND